MSSEIRIENVAYEAGGRLLLDEVTVDASAGEVLGIVGPNGAGKTTLLRIAAGKRCPTSGPILVRTAWPTTRSACGTLWRWEDTPTGELRLIRPNTIKSSMQQWITPTSRISQRERLPASPQGNGSGSDWRGFWLRKPW